MHLVPYKYLLAVYIYIGEEVKQKFLHEHFLRDDLQGFLQDVSITLINKTQPSDPNKREYYWMRTLQTLSPNGLNTEETY